jgi:hypothetical protein
LVFKTYRNSPDHKHKRHSRISTIHAPASVHDNNAARRHNPQEETKRKEIKALVSGIILVYLRGHAL